MSLSFQSFAGQNWLITPSALAVNEAKPSSIKDQKFLLVLTGVGILNLQGNNPHDWRRENLVIVPDVDASLQFAVNRFSIPKPPGSINAFDVDQITPFAAISSSFDKESGSVDAGYAVDVWRPNHFINTTDTAGKPAHKVFTGISVDLAVRNNKAVIHRVSYQITLLGRIVFLPNIIL